MSSLHYENQLLDAIETIVDNSISKAEFDKTICATIKKCEDEATGKYRVKYQDSTFIAYSSNLNVKYAEDTQVYILIPKNDMNQNKVILHAVNTETIDYVNAETQEVKYKNISENFLSGDEYSLCSYSGETFVTLYDRDNNINLINYDEIAFADEIKDADAITIGADFRTNLPIEQQSKGNYGLIYEIDFINTITGENVTRTYTLDINNMSGNPYNFAEAVSQSSSSEIDVENYKSLKSVMIFAKNFPKTENDKVEDIFISNFKLQTARIAFNGYFLGLKMDKKYFDRNDSGYAKIAITGMVYLDGDISDLAYEYYWAKLDNSIIETSDDYCRITGTGWKCLNEKIITNSAENTFEYITSANNLSIIKADCKSLENRYKLIAKLNDIVIEKEFIIKNYGANCEITIESDDGTIFYYDSGNPTLTVKVNGVEDTINYTYKWTRTDINGQRVVLNETTEENIEYNLAVAGYNKLEAQIAAGTAMPAASQDELNTYLTTIKKYDTIQRVEKNHIWKTDISIIDKAANYVCSVYNNGALVGGAVIKLTKINKVEGEYYLSIENGTQTFNYSRDGIASTSNSLENPITLQPLKISLIDSKGNEFGQSLLDTCEIKWTIPENSLIIAENSGNATLSYSLEENYDINKIDNNTIEVEVKFKEKIYHAKTNFTFVKDGEPGTNGTGVVCKIVPNIADGASLTDYPMLINGELNYIPAAANKWFKIQLWKNGSKVWEGADSDSIVTLTWENLINRYNSSTTDPHSFTIDNNNFTYNSYQENGADIVKATVEYDGATYYATLPLINTQIDNLDYQVKLVKNTGFRYIMYSNDGKYPKYDNTLPFELQVLQQINGYTEDVSIDTHNYELNYVWTIQGRKYISDFEDDKHMTFISQNRNKASYVPDETFDGENVTNAIQVIIRKQATQIAKIHIPIHFYLDRYGISAINGWDGNSIVLNQNEGIILTPQVGAGRKDSNNRFTGVIMGAVKENSQADLDEGLMGFANGQRTMFLDAKTGRATFGRTGKGQIIIDPSNNNALIYGGNYVANSSGMLINLTDASINWGNGKFSVDNAGNLKSTSGTIANWTIGANSLSQENGSIYLGAKKTATINNINRNNIVLLAGNNFGVSVNGILYANSAVLSSAEVSGTLTAGSGSKIGPWTVANTSIWYGNANYGNANGLYFGTSGLSLGSKFQVSSAGKVTATDVDISGSISATSGAIGGYTVDSYTLYKDNGNNSVGLSSTTGQGWAFWAGKAKSSAGIAPFRVGHDGSLYASTAHITGEVNATSGTFQNITVSDNCTVPAATITGVLAAERIPNLSAGKITSGTLKVGNDSYYLEMGFGDTRHPRVSGLNIGWGGIKMNNSAGITGTTDVGNDDGASWQFYGTKISTQAYVSFPGTAYILVDGTRTLSEYVNAVHGDGVNRTLWIECGEGLGWKQFVFKNGTLTAVN